MTDLSNVATLHTDIKTGVGEVMAYKADRAEINASINAVKSGLVAIGVTKKAFNRALADYEQSLTDDGVAKQKSEADAYSICRAALGLAAIEADAIPTAPAEEEGVIEGESEEVDDEDLEESDDEFEEG